MANDLQSGYQVGDWQVFPLRNVLAGKDGEVHLEPKVMQLLDRLAADAGEVVSREQLLQDLWGNRAVSDEPLTRCIAALRRVLDDSPKDPQYIQTIPKRGYRLVCPVTSLPAPESEPASDSAARHSRPRALWAVIAGVAVVLVLFASNRMFDVEDDDSPTPMVSGAAVESNQIQSIAVLPFENLSPDPANEYLADGLAAELLDRLTAVPELKVAARKSAFAFQDQDADVTEIAQRLRVAHVLVGSVRQSGERLRISVRLINAATGFHVWSQTWERPFSDVFDIQDEVALAVVDSLRIGIQPKLSMAGRTDPEAYKLYLRAREPYLAEAEPDADDIDAGHHEEAVKAVTHALAIDPDYADAWSLLASIQFNQAQWTRPDSGPAYERARASAERALSADPAHWRAMLVLAAIDIHWDWDYESAARRYKKAMLLSENHPYVLSRIEVVYSWLDQSPPEFVSNAKLHDPLNSGAILNEAFYDLHDGDLDGARTHLEEARSIAPDAIRLQVFSALLAYYECDYNQAADLVEGVNPALHLCALHQLGRVEEVEVALEALSRTESTAESIANVYACMGATDQALEWLQRAYENREWRLIFIRSQSLFENLHDDPRWDALLDQIGASDEVAEKFDQIIRGTAD
jgi:TolB-like protein/DNA-binding winged helix-turn-helix (wHTH) protein